MENSEEKESESQLGSATDRRSLLLQKMRALGDRGITCANCSGLCCTHVANSMQVTPVELRDLMTWLQDQSRLTSELKTQVEQTVTRYRLDIDVGHGRRSLRKTYTCPFYTPGPTGCSVSRSYKPYGCLAFNARAPGITEGADCGSDSELLEKREDLDTSENVENDRLRREWDLYWDKAPLPVALLEVWDRFTK